jgi:hypothetical protein
MATHRKLLDQPCKLCNHLLVEVSVKNPFIDDFDSGCDNEECKAYKDMEGQMNGMAHSIARAEYESENRDNDYYDREEENESDDVETEY